MVAFAFGTLRSVRSFVSSHAYVASALEVTVTDLLDKSVLFPIQHINWFYVSSLGISVLAYVVFHSSSLHRLKELDEYQNSYKRFQQFLFVFMFVFTKSIENAI